MGCFWSLFFTVSLFLCLSSFDVTVDGSDTQTFIVRVRNDLKPSVFTDVKQWYSSTLRSLTSETLKTQETKTDKGFLHVYKTVFHGFSAKLTAREAEELKSRPGVLSVIPDRIRQIQTTRSPQFLGLASNNPTGLLTESDSGSNVIIGVLDTGIWPERRSFNDEGLGPVPSRWRGVCSEGEKFPRTLCNKKIIGARYFTDGYEASAGSINNTTDIKSARDSVGHGTHTASTAAGRNVRDASLLGLAKGVAVGIAPKAKIAVYKICWKRGCLDSDILAAFDKAVEDGVDIISISVGGAAQPYFMDPIAIGCYGAMEKGIFVSASAGNGGPSATTVSNIAPWITTVGASTIDRKFPADLLLGDGRVITGASLYTGKPLPKKTYLPIILASNASATRGFTENTCAPESLNKEKVRGKIVVCDRGGAPRAVKGQVVKKAGGAGVIVANVYPEGEGLIADAHLIPGLAITESASDTLRHYMTSSKNPNATMVFRGTQVRVKPAPVVASFSSRGPNTESVNVIKPDVIAPGVNILAAWPDDVAPTEIDSDTRRTEFNIASGTSMSCPHVSGIAALLKGAHPDWSPAMIKSALMTTAYMNDRDGKPLLDERTYNISNVWATGAGHVNPEMAVDPGLVYDMTVDDYVNFMCGSDYSNDQIRQITRRSVSCKVKKSKPWDLNYPAISVAPDASRPSNLKFTIRRTVTHVSDGASSYTATVVNPKGAIATVNPLKLEFKRKGEKQSYEVRITAEKQPPGEIFTESGKLTWTDGKHKVTSPVVVTWQE
ncbi:subtilisin-like protease SBT1.5 [Cornus florida]|uniref:subtilisin-like protease SBT1.5 n=1 Tax=Cornus florida TaxID=4283 RepID=UPI002899A3D6|nr:subtilisin-like protease SBT1.5 [Cornus florida]